MQLYLAGCSYVTVDITAACKHLLIVDTKLGKTQVAHLTVGIVHTRNRHHATLGAKIYSALAVAHGTVIVELRA